MGAEHPRRCPRRVLGREEAIELVVTELDAEAAEQVANHPWVLDLLDRARHEEQRKVVLPEDRRRFLVAGQPIALERREAGLPARGEKLLVVGEVEERVPPVEQNGAQHVAEDRVAPP